MSERETALQECVFTVRTTSDVVNGRPVLQWASSCGQTWTPLEAVFDPRKRPTCPACEKPLRVAQRATDNPLAAQPVDAPQPCVWRKLPMTDDLYQPDCMGDNFDAAREVFDLQEWKWCPNCGHTLSVVPAAQETTTPSAKE